MTIDLSKLYAPQASGKLKVLEEDIRANGIREPITRNQHGTILSGYTRAALAEKLGIELPEQTVVTKDEVDDLKTAMLANSNRELRSSEMTGPPIVVTLSVEYGWRQIADIMNVSHTQVMRWAKIAGLLDEPEEEEEDEEEGGDNCAGGTYVPPAHSAPPRTTPKRTGRDKKSYPSRPATPTEAKRRREIVKKLWGEGYSVRAICKALDVSHALVDDDLARLKIDTKAKRTLRRDSPTTQSWRDKGGGRSRGTPAPNRDPKPEPAYKNASVVGRAEAWNTTYVQENYANLLANYLIEAERAGDKSWIATATTTFTTMAEGVNRLLRVVNDLKYRDECAFTNEGHEDFRKLRVVRPQTA